MSRGDGCATVLEWVKPHMHGCEAVLVKTYSLRNSVRVRCWSDALLSSSADWARLRKPKTLHGYNTPQTKLLFFGSSGDYRC